MYTQQHFVVQKKMTHPNWITTWHPYSGAYGSYMCVVIPCCQGNFSFVCHPTKIYVATDTAPSHAGTGISGDVTDGLPVGENYKVFVHNWFTSYQLTNLWCGYCSLLWVRIWCFCNLSGNLRNSRLHCTCREQNIFIRNWPFSWVGVRHSWPLEHLLFCSSCYATTTEVVTGCIRKKL